MVNSHPADEDLRKLLSGGRQTRNAADELDEWAARQGAALKRGREYSRSASDAPRRRVSLDRIG